MKNRNKAYFDKNGVQNEDKKLKKWEANFFDTINKYKDLDITTAHQSENSKLIESKTKIDDFNKNVVKKSMIRYLTLVIDFSKSTLK